MKSFQLFLVVMLAVPVVWAARGGTSVEGSKCQDLVKHLSSMQNYGRALLIQGHFAQLNMQECAVECSQDERENDTDGKKYVHVQSCQASGVADFQYRRKLPLSSRSYVHDFRSQVGDFNYKVRCRFRASDETGLAEAVCYSSVD